MTTEWFYSKDGGKTKIGPFSAAQLQSLGKAGQILANDLVWKKGTLKWVLASKVKGLVIEEQIPEVLPVGRPSIWELAKKEWKKINRLQQICMIFGPIFLLSLLISFCSGLGTTTFDRSNGSELLDNTASFKGKQIRVEVNYDGGGLRRDNRLITMVGRVYYRGGKFDISFDIPPSAVQPNVRPGDNLVVTFVCKEGSLSSGNEVIKIERP